MRIKKVKNITPVPGKLIDTNGTPSDTNTYNANALKKMFGGTILWTNPNPTAVFNDQSVPLNSEDWDMYEVFFIYSNAEHNLKRLNSSRSFAGYNTLLNLIGYSSNETIRRTVEYVDKKTLNFSIAQHSSNGENGGYAIPVFIVGYKTGLFD